MKAFTDFINEGKVWKQSPDPAEARSLLNQAMARLNDLQSLPLNDNNASFRFESAYEVLREAIQAFMAFQGYKPYSHEAVFSFALEKQILPEPEAYKADRYREMRNDINYRGKTATVQETMEIISFVKRAMPALEKKFKNFKALE